MIAVMQAIEVVMMLEGEAGRVLLDAAARNLGQLSQLSSSYFSPCPVPDIRGDFLDQIENSTCSDYSAHAIPEAPGIRVTFDLKDGVIQNLAQKISCLGRVGEVDAHSSQWPVH